MLQSILIFFVRITKNRAIFAMYDDFSNVLDIAAISRYNVFRR